MKVKLDLQVKNNREKKKKREKDALSFTSQRRSPSLLPR